MGNKTKLGRIVLIENDDQKPNEAPLYYRVYTEDEFGNNEKPLFLTPAEMERVKKRTERNKEDWGKRGWLQNALD